MSLFLLEKFNSAIDVNPEIKNALTANTAVSQILTPIDVLKLFERIPQDDIPLLAMDPRRSQPKDLVFTRMLVPPVSIRPSVVSDVKAGTYVFSSFLHRVIKNNESRPRPNNPILTAQLSDKSTLIHSSNDLLQERR